MAYTKVGDITSSLRKDFLALVGTKYLACNGQTVSSSAWPELVAAGVTTVPSIANHYIRAAK